MQHSALTATDPSTGPGSLHLRPSPSRSAPSGQPPPSSVSPLLHTLRLALLLAVLLCKPLPCAGFPVSFALLLCPALGTSVTLQPRNAHPCSTLGTHGYTYRETHLCASALRHALHAARFNQSNPAFGPVFGGGPTIWMGGTAPSFYKNHLYIVTGRQPLPQLSLAHCIFAIPCGSPLRHIHVSALPSSVLVLCAFVSQNCTVICLRAWGGELDEATAVVPGRLRLVTQMMQHACR